MSQLSYRQQTATGADINFTIDTFSSDELKVYVDGVLKTAGVHYNINPYNSNSQSTVDWIGTAPTSPSIVRIVRETDVLNQGNTAVEGRATYAAGSSVKADDLNNNQKQVLRSLQEHNDQLIQTYDVEPDAITTALIADGNVTTNKLADDAVTNAKVADNAIHTEQIMDGQVDAVKLNQGSGSEAVVTNAIRNSAVTSIKIADNAVTTTEILNGAVTTAKLAADAIDGTRLADNAINSEHYTDGSIDRVHLSADIIDSTKLADDAVNSEHYVDGSIDRVHLAADIVDDTKLADNAVGAEHIQANAVTDSEIATGTLDNRYFTETELTGGALDGRYFTETESDARYFNISTGDTIKNGDTFPDNDTTIATTAAINDRIVDLVEEVGGFVPIANETSFPDNSPDVNSQHGQDASRMQGTIISVKTASTNLVPSGTTVTIANGTAVGNSTVTITGVPSTIPSGFGFLVETTATANTYAFHRLTPKATEVTTVAGKATEIGRLGTADAVADMAILGTADVVADLNTLGTADVVSDMNALAVSDVISDMNTLAVTSVLNNMDTVATNVTNVNNVGGSIANVNTTAGSIANVNTVAGSISNVNTVGGAISNVNTTAGSISNVNTVASNISSVNSFANTYRIGSNNPTTSLDVGDLFFNTTSNSLKVYTGSAWVDGVTATGNFAVVTGNTFTGSNRYNDNVKAEFGTGADLEIYHDGTDSYLTNATGNLVIRNTSGDAGVIGIQPKSGENAILCRDDNNVELYYDNVLKLKTQSDGVELNGSAGLQIFGETGANSNALLDMFPTGSAAYSTIRLYGANGVDKSSISTMYGNSLYISSGGNGPITYRAAGTGDHVFETNATERMRIDGNHVKLPDGQVLHFGGGSDLQIYHDGSTASVIHAKAGDYLYIHSDNLRINTKTGSEKYLTGSVNGAVELYYDNSKKLETSSTGVTVTGDIVPPSNGTGNIGTNGSGSPKKFSQGFFDVGVSISDSTTGLRLGTGFDTLLYHNGSGTNLDHAGTGGFLFRSNNGIMLTGSTAGGEVMANFTPNGAAELYYDHSKKLNTESFGVDIAGTLRADTLKLAADNQKLEIGGSADLELYHDGSNSYIADVGTGELRLRGTTIRLTDNDGSENFANFIDNGAVELYYDNEKMFQTNQDGSEFFDSDSNLNIYFTTNDSTRRGYIFVESTNGGKISFYDPQNHPMLSCTKDGAVELFYDNSKRFETTSTGGQITGRLTVRGANDTTFDHVGVLNLTGTDAYNSGNAGSGINFVGKYNSSGSTTQLAQISGIKEDTGDGTYDGALTFGVRNDAEGVNIERVRITSSGMLQLRNDSGKIELGANQDVQLYHDGTASRLHSASHPMYIRTGGQFGVFNGNGTESILTGDPDGAVSLFYDNSLKLQTHASGTNLTGGASNVSINLKTSNGTTRGSLFANSSGEIGLLDSTGNFRLRVTGTTDVQCFNHFNPSNNNTYDLGSSSLRWRNVYTNDLHLSNEGHSNDVDGSWGNWTIQEGESDLFLKNNRSGKKYKFNLTEVS